MAPETMHGQAMALGAQLRAAAPLAQGALRGAGPFRNVALCGLGGSAAGGRLAAALLADQLQVPVEVPVGLTLPGWVGPETLVVVTSYSGETAEALDWFVEAGERRATRVALGSGGTLAALARPTTFPSSPSRAATSRAARSGCCWRRSWCCSASPVRRPTRRPDRPRCRRGRRRRGARRRGAGHRRAPRRPRDRALRFRPAGRDRGAAQEPDQRERQGGGVRRRRARDRAQRDPRLAADAARRAPARRGVPARLQRVAGGRHAQRRDGPVRRR